jgi:hypothetical protein
MKFFKKKKVIMRGNTPLMDRWTLFECRFFSIKIHKLLASDQACLHDHPWPSVSFLLSGGYVEHTSLYGKKIGNYNNLLFDEETGLTEVMPSKGKVISRFSLVYRSANFAHRLEIHQPVYTLFITFKKERIWGFYTSEGWKYHRAYDEANDRC